MVHESEGLKFLRLELENFKNIDKKIVDIGGQSIIVMGKNGAGKSSLIQALMSPLDTKELPSAPIKKGEERAMISVVIGGVVNGENKQYTVDMYFSPKNQSGRVVVTDQHGNNVKSPATFLKSQIGNVSFDVMKWLNDTKAKKLETLKALTGCAKQIDIINKEIKEKGDTKKAKKDRAEEIEAVMKNHDYTQEQINLYSKPMPTEALQNELMQVSANQKIWDDFKMKVDGLKNNMSLSYQQASNIQSEVQRKQQQIAQLQQEVAQHTEQLQIMEQNANELGGKIQQGEQWLAGNERPSSEEIVVKMNDAAAHNEHFARISTLAEKQREMLEAKQEAGTLDVDIKKLESQRSVLISKSQLPIPGLSFTDEEIMLNGIPLEEGQINTAGLFDVGVQVAMALNPGLKTIFLHDGSLFDKENLKVIVDKIESKGYQAVIEVVAENDDVEVRFTEAELN